MPFLLCFNILVFCVFFFFFFGFVNGLKNKKKTNVVCVVKVKFFVSNFYSLPFEQFCFVFDKLGFRIRAQTACKG